MVKKLVGAGVAFGLALLDLIVTCVLFGTSHEFGRVLVRSGSFRFDFCKSLLDLWLCALFRFSLVFGGVLGVCLDSQKGPDRLRKGLLVVTCVSLAMGSFSFVKILAYNEIEGSLAHNFSFWAMFCWTLCGASILTGAWLLLSKICVPPPAGEEADGGTDRSILITNEHAAEEQKKEKSDEAKEEPVLSKKESLSYIARLLRYCSTQLRFYLAGFFFLFLYSGARIFLPFYVGKVIGTIVISYSYSDLLHSVFVMMGLAAASAFFGGLRGGFFTYANAKVSRLVRGELFQSLTEQEIGFFDSNKIGELTSRLTADCETMSDTVSLNLNVLLRNLVMLVGSLVIMFKLSWQMTLINFIAIPLIGVITKYYGAYYDRLSEEAQDALAKANEVAEEVLSNMRTVRSFAAEKAESDRYWDRLDFVLRIRVKQTVAYSGYVWVNELLDVLLLVAVLWYGGHLVLTNRLSGPGLITILLYQMQLGEALVSMGYVYTGLMQSVGASRKVFEYIDRQPLIEYNGTHQPLSVPGKIEFNDVCFSYPSRPDVEVIKNLSFVVSPGETVALVGPSGGGKSSCIALLEHFYEPTGGCILVDGLPIESYQHKFLHTKVALVSQEPVLFGRSIRENVLYGLERKEGQEAEVEEAARMANAHQFIQEIPDGYSTEVGEKGVQLSGGQKQRVAIARALIRKPNILLLDEATSALDAESEHLVQQAIDRSLSGRSVVLIAHRLSTVERADRILVIDKGALVQSGTHRELLDQDGLYKNLAQRQLLGSTSECTASSSPTSPYKTPPFEIPPASPSASFKSVSP